MFVVAYDDRPIAPDWFIPFIRNTINFCDLHLITSDPNLLAYSDRYPDAGPYKCLSQAPCSIPLFGHVQDVFNSVFVNYSTNPASFELACFHRWFAINSVTSSLPGDAYICMLDTDFMIGIDPLELLSRSQSALGSAPVQFIAEWPGSNPVAIGPEITIMTKEFLYNFCVFCLTEYFSSAMRPVLLSEYFEHIGNGAEGGICDMRALAAFVRTTCIDRSFNLRNMNSPMLIGNFNEFLSSSLGESGKWSIEVHSQNHIIRTGELSNSLVGIHFQGSAKIYMSMYKNGNVVDRLTLNDCRCHESLAIEAAGQKNLVHRLLKRIGFLCKTSLQLIIKVDKQKSS